MAFVGPTLAHLPWLLTHARTPVEKRLIWRQGAFCPQLAIVNVSAPSEELCSPAHSATRSTSHFNSRELLLLLLVFRPTYGSWLNWIGAEFAATGAYIRWRNSRAEPKTNFAPQSPIRQWPDYPAKAA
ncbi:hypothetical protein [Streptomyces sp. NPDC055140]